jgi:hypothetical protein
VLVVITEPLGIKAQRIRVVFVVKVHSKYGDKDDVTSTHFKGRVRFQCVVPSTDSINGSRWWVQPEGFCEFGSKCADMMKPELNGSLPIWNVFFGTANIGKKKI